MNSTTPGGRQADSKSFLSLHDPKGHTLKAGKKKEPPPVTPTGEINFTLDPSNAAPIYRQIIQQIEYAILSGRMKSGDRLPTIRSLAVELKTNPNTIAKAYGELEIRGILETQVGSGTYISDKKPVLEDDSLNRKIKEVLGRFVHEMRDLGLEGRELTRSLESYIKEENR